MIHDSEFRAPWWARNRHVQTIVPSTLRPVPRIATRRERLELPDGDFVDLEWTRGPQSGPLVIVLHGLEGSLESRYAAGILRAVEARGWRGLLLYHRGCSGEINRLPQGYHSGQTADFDFLLRELRRREPATPLAAVGYSLGGNVLLKWLGETADAELLETAVAVSVPFELGLCSRQINEGFSKNYQRHLMQRMKGTLRQKVAQGLIDYPPEAIPRLKTFYDFDDALTGPIHGFGDAEGYYRACSSRQFLHAIRTPTLVIHAEDDPFMAPEVVPEADELSDAVRLELSRHGGHVGFMAGPPWAPRWWLEERIPNWLTHYLSH